MQLERLKYFVELAHTLHFAHAAEHLGITQPPLSRSIQKLEAEIGTPLFFRENKWDIELTEAGKIFLPEAEALLNRLARAEKMAKAAADGTRGRLTIGAIASMFGHRIFIDALAQMQLRYPDAVVEIIDSTSGTLTKLIAEHKVDLALMRLPADYHSTGERAQILYQDRLLVALPIHHPLAKRSSFPVSALKKEHFILVPESESAIFRNFVLNLCREYGNFSPQISHEISNSYTALRLTAARAGITIVSQAYCGMFPDRIIYRPFSDVDAVLPMAAVMPEGAESLLAKRFLNLLVQETDKIKTAKKADTE